mmetsp:Transcript_20779/g.38663  ORF Transcript_20779/g.38663 Transcript_20779/m.38663 type:complete len:733 (-) Transcript_20779:261-2459(-)
MRAVRRNRGMKAEKAQETLADLQKAIRMIFNQNASELSFEELYRNAYNMVLYKHGDILYHGVESEVNKHLVVIGDQVAAASGPETLLSELVEKWRLHTKTMKMIHDILMYMDRIYVSQQEKAPIYDVGLRIFRDKVVRHPNVRDRMLEALLSNIERERDGELIDQTVIRNILQMLVELGIKSLKVYEEDFESRFLAVTKQFYQQEAMLYIQTNTCPDYVLKAEARLEEEKHRAQKYLNSSSEEKVLRLVADELVVAHSSQLVHMPNSGCRSMLEHNKVEDLRRLYDLFQYKSCREEIKQCVYDCCKEVGERLVDDKESDIQPVDFVKQMIDLQEKYELIVQNAFSGDKSFQKVVRDAFEHFVNMNQRTSRFLSMFLDELLRNKIKLSSNDDSELNQVVDQVVTVFRHIHDKDIFENFYKEQLSKRLLSGRSMSEDAESSVIKKLKTECGYMFTSKLEGMFRDMRLSKEAMDGFRGACSQIVEDGSPELQVTVLTAGFWPTKPAQLCTIPTVLDNICKRFTSFYLGAHNGRRLTWQTNLGTADIKARFKEDVTHEFNVTTYQMSILDMFNTAEEITFEEIQHSTNIEEQELKRHLMSLAAPKFRILNKDSKGRVLEKRTVFSVNTAFRSKHYRVRIPLISSRENLGSSSKSSEADVPEQVGEVRRHLIEAAVVRIMKSRKTLEHSLLIAEVTKQMSGRFIPSPQDIKKRIEGLIEREYLERTETDRRTYQYLA